MFSAKILNKYIRNKCLSNVYGERFFYIKPDRICFGGYLIDDKPIYHLEIFNIMEYITEIRIFYDKKINKWVITNFLDKLISINENINDNFLPLDNYEEIGKSLLIERYNQKINNYLTFYDFRKRHLLTKESKKFITCFYYYSNKLHNLPIEMVEFIISFLRFVHLGNKF